ncbi:MAG: hypothetical protein KDI51_19625 [Xanthomonadales bacterium]|nr:hypothetical protein [Xanthomonadales bacterium]
MSRVAFSFLYLPFTLTREGDCLLSGRVVPDCSTATPSPFLLQPLLRAERLVLRLVANAPELQALLASVLRQIC